MSSSKRSPRCIVIADPNGAGKTTVEKEYLLRVAKVIHFVNTDLIAGGLSPLKPELAAIAAARLVLRENLAMRRIAARVFQGGHDLARMTLFGISNVDGKNLNPFTCPWQSLGRYMTIRESRPVYWRSTFESDQAR